MASNVGYVRAGMVVPAQANTTGWQRLVLPVALPRAMGSNVLPHNPREVMFYRITEIVKEKKLPLGLTSEPGPAGFWFWETLEQLI